MSDQTRKPRRRRPAGTEDWWRLQIRLEPELRAPLERWAREERRTVNAQIEYIVKQALPPRA